MPHDYEALFEESAPSIWRVMYAVSGGRRDIAEEAVAESFARAIEHSESIRDPLPWIYRTAFRIVAEELARDRKRVSLPELPAPGAAEGLGRLVGALRKLSPNQRAAIVLRYEEDLEMNEVAKHMGMSASTVRVHLHRGRRRLRRLLEEEER